MRRIPCVLTISLALVGASHAQENAPTLDQLIPAVEEWLQENIDENVLKALQDVDREKVQRFFGELQRRFQGTSIYDLAGLTDTASRLLPVLQQETQPYAAWLQTHLDYLETADQLLREAQPAVPKAPPPTRLPGPSPQRQRLLWNQSLVKRPWPARAQEYVPRLKQIFAAERMPAELVWVAEVESSFNPAARSPVGAVGLFQLMPATARSLNLSLRPQDERLHAEKNARAAAKYLRQLHGRFGDWRLALAAYNAGETRVDGLLKQKKARDFDTIAPELPAETQMFVPKVEATVRKREGQNLAELKIPNVVR